MTDLILRKVCSHCEKVAKPTLWNAFGDLHNWINTKYGWFCPDCPVKR